MTTTIAVEDSTLERFNQLKEEQNEPRVPEMNADLFLNSLMDTLEAVEDGHYGDADDPLTLSEVDEIAEQLNQSLEGMGNVQRVMNRIDDLETELTKQHERMGGR